MYSDLFSSRYLIAAVLMVVLALTLGLQEQTTAAPIPTHLLKPPFIHPTAVGTKWVYDDGNGSNEITLLLTKVEKTNATQIITIEKVNENGKTSPYEKLLLTKGEWSKIEREGDKFDPAWCLLKFPHTEEHKWEFVTYRGKDPNKFKGTVVQEAKTELRKVPAGEFDAVKVVSTMPILFESEILTNWTHWYASGVGLVQADNMVLKSFKRGKE